MSNKIDYERYNFLERELDRDDLSDELFSKYNREINDIQTLINNRKNQIKVERLEKEKELQEIKEQQFIESLTEQMVDKMYEDTCLKYEGVNGMSFKEWYQKSCKYYSIDSTFNVHSKARSSDPTKIEIVPCHSLAHAKYRILTLIKHKFRDHAERGYDFAWDVE